MTTNESCDCTENQIENQKSKDENDLSSSANAKELKGKWNFSNFIQKTPCARTSLMFGISSGAAVGVAAFAYTKHVKRSCDIAVGSFALGSLASWSYCYYNRTQRLRSFDKIVSALRKKNAEVQEKRSAEAS